MKHFSFTEIVVTVAVLSAVGPADAGVVSISRLSTLRVAGTAGPDTFDQTRSSSGDLADVLSDEATSPDGSTGAASASQTAGFLASTPGGITGRAAGGGDVSASFPLNGPLDLLIVTARSEFSFSFRVIDTTEPFTVRGKLEGAFASAAVSLSGTSDPASPSVVFSSSNESSSSTSFNGTGELTPGIYTFSASAFAGSTGGDGSDAQFSNFGTTFSFGNPVRPIPLPPALMSGGGMLILLAAGRMFFRRWSEAALKQN